MPVGTQTPPRGNGVFGIGSSGGTMRPEDLGPIGGVLARLAAPGTTGAAPGGAPMNNNTALAPLGGWAAGAGGVGYNPVELNANVYDAPFTLLQDIMPGLDPFTPGYNTLRDFGADPLALFNIMQGSQTTPQGGPGEFANWYANLVQNIGTPGGQWFDGPQMMQQLFNPAAGSSLESVLGVGNAAQQARTMFNLYRDATNVSMNPLAARAAQARMAAESDNYINMAMKSPSNEIPGMAEYIRKTLPQLTGGR